LHSSKVLILNGRIPQGIPDKGVTRRTDYGVVSVVSRAVTGEHEGVLVDDPRDHAPAPWLIENQFGFEGRRGVVGVGAPLHDG